MTITAVNTDQMLTVYKALYYEHFHGLINSFRITTLSTPPFYRRRNKTERYSHWPKVTQIRVRGGAGI